MTMVKHQVTAANAAKIQKWFEDRGGIAIWESVNLSNPGASWTTPATSPVGGPPEKPSWQAASAPARVITDQADVDVIVPKLVKRFHIGVRMGSNGTMLKVTDGGTRRIRRELTKAGEGSWYEFDYEQQDVLIYVPGEAVPLSEWTV